MRCPDRSKCFLSQRPASARYLKNFGFDDGVKGEGNDVDCEIERHNTNDDEGKLPLNRKGDDEGREEHGESLNACSELLGDAVGNEVAVSGDLA